MYAGLTSKIVDRLERLATPDVRERVALLEKNTNEYGYDEFGFSRDWLRRVVGLSSWLYKNYFRVETHGIENIPPGRVILAGNHSSQMAYDGLLIITSLLLECDPPRHPTGMAGHFFFNSGMYSQLMPRIGQVNGTKENCQQVLARDQLALIFPEGDRGGGKTIFDRYKLMPFKHGFMRLALDSNTPIVPFAFIGGEEMVPSFSRMESLAKRAGMPYFNLSPTGVLPLPTKCSIYFGKPLAFSGASSDAAQVGAHVAVVEDRVRELIATGLARRTSIF